MEGLLRRSSTPACAEADRRRNAPGRNPLGLWAGAVLLLLLGASASGCVGYFLGWPDAEVKRLRRVVAEVEAKNAELVEEVLRLRKRLDELESSSAAPASAAEAATARRSPDDPVRD